MVPYIENPTKREVNNIIIRLKNNKSSEENHIAGKLLKNGKSIKNEI